MMKRGLPVLLSGALCILCAFGCKAEDDIQPIPTPAPQAPDVVVNQELLPPEHSIFVTGYGKVIATPDYATITLGVQGSAETAEQASALCVEHLNSVNAALLAFGVRIRDITAAGISITANLRESDGAVLGYTATDTITIIAHDVATANGVMSGAIDAGASAIYGITYSLTDAKPVYQQAREAAMDDALQKAQVLAEAGGATLGAVIGVEETPSDSSKLVGVDSETSSIVITAQVSVQYLIVD